MLFEQEFIDTVSENPTKAVVTACQIVLDKLGPVESWTDSEFDIALEGVIFVEEIIDSHDLEHRFLVPDVQDNTEVEIHFLREYLIDVRQKYKTIYKKKQLKLKKESLQNKYRASFKANFAYEFSEHEINRIQKLINELRDCISGNEDIEASHKQRLLNRLEKLQSELHKRVSDLDRFWGLVGDAGVALGKFGTDAKPIVDRIKELTSITWNAQQRSEGLPENVGHPLLGESDT